MTSTLVTREHLMQISFLGPFVTHFEFLANKVEKRRYYCIFVTGWNVFSKVAETYPLNQPEEKSSWDRSTRVWSGSGLGLEWPFGANVRAPSDLHSCAGNLCQRHKNAHSRGDVPCITQCSLVSGSNQDMILFTLGSYFRACTPSGT